VPIATRAASLLASKDPGPVVIDEVIAVPLVLTVVPPSDRGWPVLVAAFVLFRVFDIVKPPPCRRLERLPAGLGIMADDQAAAVYGAACLALARWQEWL
jgi:phosphatidylglycerophosphatase A